MLQTGVVEREIDLSAMIVQPCDSLKTVDPFGSFGEVQASHMHRMLPHELSIRAVFVAKDILSNLIPPKKESKSISALFYGSSICQRKPGNGKDSKYSF